MNDKQYLGDGVYAKMDDYGMLILTTENGQEITNVIYLESDVWRALQKFMTER